MPRQGRIHIPGGLYHVMARGIERRRIFADHKDRLAFVRRLAEGLTTHQIKCYAWALLPNHVHLLLSPSHTPLGDLMRGLLTGYAMYFNRRHKRVGHLFQNRYRSILCQKESYFLELVRYIHLNPVRNKLVKCMAELDGYPWCGHCVLIGKVKNTWQERGEVLSQFGGTKREALSAYWSFLLEGARHGTNQDLERGTHKWGAKGWQRQAPEERPGNAWRGDERILGDEKFAEEAIRSSRSSAAVPSGMTIEAIVRKCCESRGMQAEELQSKWKRGKENEARAKLAFLANQAGLQGIVIARYLGITPAAVSYLIKRGAREAMERKEDLII